MKTEFLSYSSSASDSAYAVPESKFIGAADIRNAMVAAYGNRRPMSWGLYRKVSLPQERLLAGRFDFWQAGRRGKPPGQRECLVAAGGGVLRVRRPSR